MLALLAALILCGPVEPPDWLVEQPAVYAAVEQVARAEEVATSSDGQCWLCVSPDGMERFHTDRAVAVSIWRTRYRTMQGIPHTWERTAFTGLSYEACGRQLDFASGWLAIARRRHALETRPQWQEELRLQIAEVEQRMELWGELRWAFSRYASPVSARNSLDVVRQRLGPAAFYRGTMPLIVPVEYFQRD